MTALKKLLKKGYWTLINSIYQENLKSLVDGGQNHDSAVLLVIARTETGFDFVCYTAQSNLSDQIAALISPDTAV